MDIFDDPDIEEVFNYLKGKIESHRDGQKLPTDEEIVKYLERDNNTIHTSHNAYNVIPSDENSKGGCCKLLVVFCLGRSNLDNRLRQMVYHTAIYCREKTEKVLIMTDKWDDKIFKKHSNALKIIKERLGVKFYVAQHTGNTYQKYTL